jgi:hypothetical protein
MWCEIRRHTLRHLYRGYWSVLRVVRASQKGLRLKNVFLVFLALLAPRTQKDK